MFSTELTVVPSSGGRPSPRSAPPTLRPCAADAYLLFKVVRQKSLSSRLIDDGLSCRICACLSTQSRVYGL